MIAKLFAVFFSICFSCIMGIPILFKFFTVGPSKMLQKKKNGSQPEELNDKKYGVHKYIRLKTVKLHYVISGPQEAPLMLMLHGFPELWYSWRHQITAFQDKYRVVAVDMRGYGESDKPEKTEDYKMEFLMEDIKLLLEALEYKSCVLVAHDWGGTVAWAFANQFPEMVDRLIVMNMVPLPVWRGSYMSNLKQFFASGYISVFFVPFLPEFVLGLGDCSFFTNMYKEVVDREKSGKVTNKDIECYKFYYRQPGAFTGGLNYYRANLWPPAYCQPGLTYPMRVKVIWGCKDKYVTLSALDQLTQVVPDVDITTIENAGHWIQVDQPERVNQIMKEFLDKA